MFMLPFIFNHIFRYFFLRVRLVGGKIFFRKIKILFSTVWSQKSRKIFFRWKSFSSLRQKIISKCYIRKVDFFQISRYFYLNPHFHLSPQASAHALSPSLYSLFASPFLQTNGGYRSSKTLASHSRMCQFYSGNFGITIFFPYLHSYFNFCQQFIL